LSDEKVLSKLHVFCNHFESSLLVVVIMHFVLIHCAIFNTSSKVSQAFIFVELYSFFETYFQMNVVNARGMYKKLFS